MSGVSFMALIAAKPSGVVPIGTPASIGSVSATYSNNLTTGTLTTTGAIPAGSLAVVFINVNANTAPPITAVSDGTNTYVQDGTIAGTFGTTAIWYKENAAAVGSGATITVTFTATAAGAGNFYNIAAVTVTGILISSSLDKTATQSSVTATPTVTTAALAQANEIAFGASGDATVTTYTEDATFTNLFNFNASQRFGVGYKIVAATTAVTYAPVFGAAGGATTITVIGTYKGN